MRDAIVDVRHSGWQRLGFATALYRSEKFTEAIEALNKSLKGTRDSLAAYDHYVLAACYVKLGQLKSASEHFSKAEENFEKFRGENSPDQLQELETFRAEAKKLIGYFKSREETKPN